MPSTSKYGNQRSGKYASKREAKRASELHFLADRGIIKDLEEQVRFELIPKQVGSNGILNENAIHYVADFSYYEDDVLHIEDVKGFKADVYLIKRKLMLYIHKIKIEEV